MGHLDEFIIVDLEGATVIFETIEHLESTLGV